MARGWGDEKSQTSVVSARGHVIKDLEGAVALLRWQMNTYKVMGDPARAQHMVLGRYPAEAAGQIERAIFQTIAPGRDPADIFRMPCNRLLAQIGSR